MSEHPTSFAGLFPKDAQPIGWLYPEGLEALKAGKPWTVYGTRQGGDCNIPVYLAPIPDREPYAWVTFTPDGEEDDVWYENPEGKLLEDWTYRPLYDSTPPQRQPLIFPTMLRKMWSGAEVQAWLDENYNNGIKGE